MRDIFLSGFQQIQTADKLIIFNQSYLFIIEAN